jgi:hypothetical protein
MRSIWTKWLKSSRVAAHPKMGLKSPLRTLITILQTKTDHLFRLRFLGISANFCVSVFNIIVSESSKCRVCAVCFITYSLYSY